MSILATLAGALASGAVEVVDLTSPLSAETPVIQLPPEFGQTAPFELEEISRYDDRGPAWYWNNFRTGEHTGTHFDAPNHWVTGQGPRRRRLGAGAPAGRARGGARLLGRRRPRPRLPARGRAHPGSGRPSTGRCPRAAGCSTAPAGTPGRRRRSASSTPTTTARTRPGISPECARWLAEESPVIGLGVETVGTDAGAAHSFDPPFPCHSSLMGSGKYGLTQLQNLAQLPPTGAVSSPARCRSSAAPAPRRGCWRWSSADERRGRRRPGAGPRRASTPSSAWSARATSIVTNAMVAAGARFVAARHEGGAATMADAYARMSGRSAALTVHQGCGLTNAMTGIAEAAKSRTPLVVVAAEATAAAVQLLRRPGGAGAAVGAVPMRVDSAGDRGRPGTARGATARARTGASVLLNLPLDVQAAGGRGRPEAAAAAVAVRSAGRPTTASGGWPTPCAPPGGRCSWPAADPAGRQPGRARGARRPHRRAAGDLGRGQGPVRRQPVVAGRVRRVRLAPGRGADRGADLIVGWGCALNMWTMRHGRLIGPRRHVVQVDLDADAARRPPDRRPSASSATCAATAEAVAAR